MNRQDLVGAVQRISRILNRMVRSVIFPGALRSSQFSVLEHSRSLSSIVGDDTMLHCLTSKLQSWRFVRGPKIFEKDEFYRNFVEKHGDIPDASYSISKFKDILANSQLLLNYFDIAADVLGSKSLEHRFLRFLSAFGHLDANGVRYILRNIKNLRHDIRISFNREMPVSPRALLSSKDKSKYLSSSLFQRRFRDHAHHIFIGVPEGIPRDEMDFDNLPIVVFNDASLRHSNFITTNHFTSMSADTVYKLIPAIPFRSKVFRGPIDGSRQNETAELKAVLRGRPGVFFNSIPDKFFEEMQVINGHFLVEKSIFDNAYFKGHRLCRITHATTAIKVVESLLDFVNFTSSEIHTVSNLDTGLFEDKLEHNLRLRRDYSKIRCPGVMRAMPHKLVLRSSILRSMKHPSYRVGNRERMTHDLVFIVNPVLEFPLSKRRVFSSRDGVSPKNYSSLQNLPGLQKRFPFSTDPSVLPILFSVRDIPKWLSTLTGRKIPNKKPRKIIDKRAVEIARIKNNVPAISRKIRDTINPRAKQQPLNPTPEQLLESQKWIYYVINGNVPENFQPNVLPNKPMFHYCPDLPEKIKQSLEKTRGKV